MDNKVTDALMLYVTDRNAFNEKYAGTSDLAYCDELMMGSESRPHSAERIAILLMGHNIHREKKYDGEIHQNGRLVRYSEYKVTCRYSGPDGKCGSMSSIGHNDVSQAIVDRYLADQPLFVFPFFIDGHLAAMFSVDFAVIQPKYVAHMANRSSTRSDGRSVVTLSLSDWLDHSKVEFIHSDPEVVQKLSRSLQAKIYQTHQPQQRSNTMSNITRFPAGHKFERYGYDLVAEEAYSFITKPEGRIVKTDYSINDSIHGDLKISDIREQAARIAGVTLTTKRPSPYLKKKMARVSVSSSNHVTTKFATPQTIHSANTVRATIELPDSMSLGDLLRKLQGTGAKITIEA